MGIRRFGDSTVASGASLRPDESRTSCDGRFTLIYQFDGNLVLYHNGVGPIWASGTGGGSPGQTIMQGDGNLVIYDGGGPPIWSSGTAGYPGARLVVQTDGNTVIYLGSSPIWHTGTCCR